jgi:hypothetical protein
VRAKLGHWWVAGGARAAKKSLRASSGLKITGRTKTEKKRVLFIFIFQKAFKHVNSNASLNSSNKKTILQHECNIKLLWFINLNFEKHLNAYKSH